MENKENINLKLWVEIAEYRCKIVCHYSTFLSVIFTLAILLLLPYFPIKEATLVEIASQMITYASIAVGSSITVYALLAPLVRSPITREWDKENRSESELSLMVLLSWTVVVQLFLLVYASGVYFFGYGSVLMPLNPLPSHVFFLFLGAFVFVYSIVRLLVMISAVYQFFKVSFYLLDKASPD